MDFGELSRAAAGFDVRGVMLDPARLMDRKGEYFSLLPHLKDWGYNLLHLHLTDDQGSRLVFPRRPELAPQEEKRATACSACSTGCAESGAPAVRYLCRIQRPMRACTAPRRGRRAPRARTAEPRRTVEGPAWPADGPRSRN